MLMKVCQVFSPVISPHHLSFRLSSPVFVLLISFQQRNETILLKISIPVQQKPLYQQQHPLSFLAPPLALDWSVDTNYYCIITTSSVSPSWLSLVLWLLCSLVARWRVLLSAVSQHFPMRNNQWWGTLWSASTTTLFTRVTIRPGQPGSLQFSFISELRHRETHKPSKYFIRAFRLSGR